MSFPKKRWKGGDILSRMVLKNVRLTPNRGIDPTEKGPTDREKKRKKKMSYRLREENRPLRGKKIPGGKLASKKGTQHFKETPSPAGYQRWATLCAVTQKKTRRGETRGFPSTVGGKKVKRESDCHCLSEIEDNQGQENAQVNEMEGTKAFADTIGEKTFVGRTSAEAKAKKKKKGEGESRTARLNQGKQQKKVPRTLKKSWGKKKYKDAEREDQGGTNRKLVTQTMSQGWGPGDGKTRKRNPLKIEFNP